MSLDRRTIGWVLVGLAVVVYLGLALYQYRLPGLYYDEAGDVVPAMRLLQGEPVDLQRGVGIHLFGLDFPVMIGDYWGVTSTYAVLPLFAIFGYDVLPIRLFPILACAAAIPATYVFGRRLFNEWVGVAAALLLAVSPTYVFWSRIGIYVIAHIVAIALGVMLAYLSWRDRPRLWKLAICGFLAGLGLTTKLLFLWFFIAVPAAYLAVLVFDRVSGVGNTPDVGATRRVAPAGDGTRRRIWPFVRDHLRRYLPARNPVDGIVLVGGFLVGAFPVIYYNLVSRGSYYLLRSNFGQTERGVDNFAILENLRNQLEELRVFLDGGFFWFLGGVYTNPIGTYSAAVAVVGLAGLLLLPEYARYRRAYVFLLSYAAVIFLLSCFSISILAATHLFILLPLPQVALAAFVVLGTRAAATRIPSPRLALAPAAAGIVFLAGFAALDLRADLRYHQALERTGGLTAFSDAIYPLANYLDEHNYHEPYALDWGVRPNVIILTAGRVTPLEIYGHSLEPGAAFDQTVQQTLTEESPVFISQTEVSSAFPRLDRFRTLVEASGREVVLDRVFRQRNGVPAYYLFRVTGQPVAGGR